MATVQIKPAAFRRDHVAWALTIVAVTMIAVTLRIITLSQYEGQVDEPASLLAIKRTSEAGYPLYPSGVLYLQGAVLTYLTAPIALFSDESDLLRYARLVNVALSVLLIPLVASFVTYISGSRAAGLLAAVMTTLDPNLINWSVAIRPYGLLTLETVAFVYAFVKLCREGTTSKFGPVRTLTFLPLVALLGTFTHIGFWLSAPALAICAVLRWRRSLLVENRAILYSGMASLVPLAIFFVLGNQVGIGNGTGEGNVGESFVGSHLFSLDRFTSGSQFSFEIWLWNFVNGVFHPMLPWIILLTSVVLIGSHHKSRNEPEGAPFRDAVTVLLAVHWSSVMLVTLLVTSDPVARYLNQVLPLGYAIVAVSVVRLLRRDQPRRFGSPVLRGAFVIVLLAPSIAYGVTAAYWRIGFGGSEPDYLAATEWTTRHVTEGQVVVSTLPATFYFWSDSFPDDTEFSFLAGPEGSERSERYVRQTTHGLGDYWLGVDPIDSVDGLCAVLSDVPGSVWIITDENRISAQWAYEGAFANVLIGATDAVYSGENGAVVARNRPIGSWTPMARSICQTRAV